MSQCQLEGRPNERRARGSEGRRHLIHFGQQLVVYCHLDCLHSHLVMWILLHSIIHSYRTVKRTTCGGCSHELAAVGGAAGVLAIFDDMGLDLGQFPDLRAAWLAAVGQVVQKGGWADSRDIGQARVRATRPTRSGGTSSVTLPYRKRSKPLVNISNILFLLLTGTIIQL